MLHMGQPLSTAVAVPVAIVMHSFTQQPKSNCSCRRNCRGVVQNGSLQKLRARIAHSGVDI